MPEPRVRACGKQLQLDGRHLADCRDYEAAEVIAICLNRAGVSQNDWPVGELPRVLEFFA
jgi:hypothetical protein